MFYSKNLKKIEQLKHCFFSKKNGFSKGIYSSLNCGKGSKDNKKNIYKNLNYVAKIVSNDISEEAQMIYKLKYDDVYPVKNLKSYMENLFK